MTKFSATLIALLCFFTLCTAHTLPENDDSTTTPHSQFTPALRLPSENPTETTTAVEITSVPLTKTAFHLVNHRFPARSKKPCHPHGKVLPTTRENEMISYGNDMLVASGENSDFQNPVIHGEESWVPRRWVRMHGHHHHNEDSDSDSDDEEEEDRTDQDKKKKKKKSVFKRYRFDKYGGEDQELKVLKMMKHNEKKKGCFFKRVRKFLDHYF